MASYGHPLVTKERVEELEAQISALTKQNRILEVTLSEYTDLHAKVAALTKERDAFADEVRDLSNEIVLQRMKAKDEAETSDRAWNKLETAQARIKVLREALEGFLGPSQVWDRIKLEQLLQPDDTTTLDELLKAERERCAKVCEEMKKDIVCPDECAAAIREMK